MLFVLPLYAQTPTTLNDTTLQQLRHFDEDPNTKSANLFFGRLDKEKFTDQKIAFTPTTPPDTLKAQVWYWAAEYHYAASHYAEAEKYALQTLPLLKSGGDELTLADCLNVLSIANVRMSRYQQAISYARQCYELDERSGDAERISMSLNTLAGLYLSARMPQEAEQYVKKGLELAKTSGLEHRQAIVEGMASEVYHAMGRDEEAVTYAEQAYQTEMHLERPHKAMVRLSQKAAALIGLKRYDEANEALQQAIAFFREHGGQQQSLGISLNKQGEALLGLKRTDEAKASYREAASLFLEIGDKNNEMHARQGLYECLYKTEPDSARTEMERFVTLRDSLYDFASAESLARYNAEFGNDLLRQEKEAERTAKWCIIGITALLLVIMLVTAILLLRYYRRQQERIKLLLERGIRNSETTAQTAENEARRKPADQNFTDKTNDIIRRLMTEGQVDTVGVATELNLSPSQFRRKIQAASGLTAANYILAIRMEEAKLLLAQHPKYTVSEIAMRCGFADNAHFTHAFKRIFHITPSEYIKTNMN